jgi:hypothetical protein
MQVLLESRRLMIAKWLDLAQVLVAEFDNFKTTKTKLGNDSYGAGADWREGNHDDLVLALAMAAWAGEYDLGAQVTAMRSRFAIAAHLKDQLGPGWATMLG